MTKTLILKATNWPTDSGNFIISILNYKLARFVSILRLPNEQKQAKQRFQEKNLATKVSKALKNEHFTRSCSVFS